MQKLLLVLFLSSIALISCGKNEDVFVEHPEESQILASAEEEMKIESLESIEERMKDRSLSKSEYGRENPFALIGETKLIKKARIEKRQKPKLRLDGIIWDAKNPLAIIDGKTVGLGDRIGDKTIEKIEEDSVILFDGKNRIRLRL